ncbi:glycosyltransferase family 2 protein [Parabacteroides sp.]
MKKIVVLLSTYNGERFLCAQLDSLMAQEGVVLRVLARDDGSLDGTREILADYEERYPGVLEVIEGENVGFAMSFTRLLQRAVERYVDADYFAFCDQDDVWMPDKLKAAVDRLIGEDQSLPLAYCSNTTLVDVNLRVIRQAWNPREVVLTKERALIQSFATGCTMVFNRVAAETYVTHLPEVIKVHDFLMYQLCMFLGKVVWDEKSHILYRQHGNNQIGKKDFMGRMRKRMEGHYKEHVLELQNRRFLVAYKDLLSVEDVGLISRLVFYRKNWLSRLLLLFDGKIKYTQLESNFFYVLKIIKGGV